MPAILTEQDLLPASVDALNVLLPERWSAETAVDQNGEDRVTIRDPSGTGMSFVVEAIARPTPAGLATIVANRFARKLRKAGGISLLVVAPFLSTRSRAVLDAEGVNYLDLTGNTSIINDFPGMVIRTRGADRDPTPAQQATRGLGGPVAGQVVRALVDIAPPYNVTELARLADVNTGYCSRVLQVLAAQALIVRTERGLVTEVAWADLLRERANAAGPLFDLQRTTSYITRASTASVLDRLRNLNDRFVITGSFAASRIAPVAAPRGLVVYCDTPETIAAALDLLPADEGGDLRIIRPRGSAPYQRTRREDGLEWAAPSQIVLDGLTGTGRMPEEADAVLEWMTANEATWRAAPKQEQEQERVR